MAKIERVVVKERHMLKNKYVIDSTETVLDYGKKFLSLEGQLGIISLNTKNEMENINILNVNTFRKYHDEVMTNILLNNSNTICIVDNFSSIEESEEFAYEIRDYTSSLNIKVLDYVNLKTEKSFHNIFTDTYIITDNIYTTQGPVDLKSSLIDNKLYLEQDGGISVNSLDLNCVLDTIYSDLRSYNKENIYLINLDKDLNIINYSVAAVGVVNETYCEPKELLKIATLSQAEHCIVLHNHPSGKVSPSNEDDKTTAKVHNAFNSVGINLLDHIIVGSTEEYSYRKSGRLTELIKGQCSKLENSNMPEYEPEYKENTSMYIKANLEIGDTVKTDAGKVFVLDKKDNDLLLQRLGNKYASPYVIAHNMLYKQTDNKYIWDSGKYFNDLNAATTCFYNNYENIAKTMKSYARNNHREYIKSVISIESGIENQQYLDEIYDRYMEDDSMQLMNIEDIIENGNEYSEEYSNEITKEGIENDFELERE